MTVRGSWMVVALLALGCASQKSAELDEHAGEEENAESVSLSEEASEIAGVEVSQTVLRPMQASFAVSGVVASTTKGRSVVTPPVAGRIVAIHVDIGQFVRAGQTVVVLDSSELAEAWAGIADSESSKAKAEADLTQARAEVELTKARVDSARETLARLMELVSAGAFSQAPMQAAQRELHDAQSELMSDERERATHVEQVRRLESLYQDGLVSKSDLDAAKLELEHDSIRVARSTSRLALAKEAFEREKTIAEKGLHNSREIRTAEADVRAAEIEHARARTHARTAEAAVKIAERAFQNARATYAAHASGGAGSVGRLELKAAIDGTVTSLDATLGQAVDRAAELLRIENLDAVWITANLPERQATQVALGDRVSVQTPSQPGRSYAGIVQVVGARIDPETRTLPIQCLVTGPGGLLKPEMFATVSVFVGAARDVLAVPETAIVEEDGTKFVFVQDGDHFERREVKTDGAQGGFVAILSGLDRGEVIAVKGLFILSSELKKSELKGHDH